jgi:molybdenum cofactor cytidylyltransferase
MILNLPAIVAASGLSTRMGTSKALMEVGGETFLARIIHSLREGGVGSVLVVVRDPEGPEGQEAKAMGARPVLNANPGQGPISSLQAGLEALPEDSPGVLFCPVDHPLFRPQTVQTLVDAFMKEEPPFVAPAFQGRRGHPVLFGRTLFPELSSPDLPEGARTVVARYLERRVVVDVQDPGILADINTPDEYKSHFPEGQ